jgi:hypothetical protein
MTAFRATYSDWKLIKTRGVVQVVMEIPVGESDAAYEVLGGMPVHGKERWFGIAAINLSQAKEDAPAKPGQNAPKPDRVKQGKRDWRDMPYSQQAAIRVGEATFAAYLREEHPNDWHETHDADACLKLMCGIESKRELATSGKPATLWFQIDSAYSAWLAKERVGA